VELEPVREYSEYEQEDGESKQHHSRHYAHSVPDLSGGLRHETMERQAKTTVKRMPQRRTAVKDATHICRADSPSLRRASAVNPKIKGSTSAFRQGYGYDIYLAGLQQQKRRWLGGPRGNPSSLS